MSEPPARYAVLLTCEECGRRFEPDPEEEEAAGELERAFPDLGKRTLVCAECAQRRIQ